ncbi:MAG: fumarylacetoacetase [Bacteroidota bacterium]
MTYQTDSVKSWVPVPQNSDFPIQNLPFGIFSEPGGHPRTGIAIGNKILDLRVLSLAGLFSGPGEPHISVFESSTLNSFIALGKAYHKVFRNRITELLSAGNNEMHHAGLSESAFTDRLSATMYLPVSIGDYSDFYSSRQHAFNVGSMFRDPDNALLPNWLHLPVAYHGRASSINISGTPVRRPWGQVKPADKEKPSFSPTRMLDFELETAFIIGRENGQGNPIGANEAEDYIFGYVLFNDWSARDIQSWEYVPLGPFLAKNFASTISPWVVTCEALEPYRVFADKKEPEVLPYLETQGPCNYEVELEVFIQPENGPEVKVSHSNMKHLYWSPAQQLAHHTVNGCNMRIGDLCAGGTISGPEPGSFGSMLELSWRGTKPIKMPDGTTRSFIQDHDTVIIRAYANRLGQRIGFGEVSSKVLPALPATAFPEARPN